MYFYQWKYGIPKRFKLIIVYKPLLKNKTNICKSFNPSLVFSQANVSTNNYK